MRKHPLYTQAFVWITCILFSSHLMLAQDSKTIAPQIDKFSFGAGIELMYKPNVYVTFFPADKQAVNYRYSAFPSLSRRDWLISPFLYDKREHRLGYYFHFSKHKSYSIFIGPEAFYEHKWNHNYYIDKNSNSTQTSTRTYMNTDIHKIGLQCIFGTALYYKHFLMQFYIGLGSSRFTHIDHIVGRKDVITNHYWVVDKKETFSGSKPKFSIGIKIGFII